MVTLTSENIGTRIRSCAPEVMRTWEASVRREIPGADEGELDDLRRCLPELLTSIAEEVDQVQEPASSRKLQLAQVHGADRAQLSDYSLFGVVLEYRILRKALTKVLEEQSPLSPRDREIITDVLEEAMQEATSEYMAHTRRLSLADRQKNDLLATVAHELRTPLGAVVNALYVLEHTPLNERAVRQVEAAQRQVRHIGRIIEDLLDITSIVEGKVGLRMAPLTIENIIQDAIATVLPLMESRNQSLTSSITSHGIINGDADRLEQIMLNLLNNAAKYTE